MKVVVVGGGFGGVKTAIELARRGFEDITLIADKDALVIHNSLPRAIAGANPCRSAIPLNDILSRYPAVSVKIDTITSIDTEKQTVGGKHVRYAYDTLVLAVGLVDRLAGTHTRKNHSYVITGDMSAQAFWEDLNTMLTEDAQKEHCVAVIGGGMTGVGLAGALGERLSQDVHKNSVDKLHARVLLAESQERILPTQSPTASYKVTRALKKYGVELLLGHAVDRSNKTQLIVNNRIHDVDMAVWALGGSASPLFRAYSDVFKLSKRGRVIVNQYMSAYPNIYIIGDSAERDAEECGATALDDAVFIAKHLNRHAHEQLLRARNKRAHVFTSIPVTRSWVYTEYMGVYAAGKTGSIFRHLFELSLYMRLLPLRRAVNVWWHS